ncbi:MFS transporter [Advenella sp. FME57]|uniref:MFS transporter n=1 Tax=Advenella sp. FME57 TaxID=2742604 RepID=UPI0018693A72|nr:MFS transporter [Advenella sp. FME57]
MNTVLSASSSADRRRWLTLTTLCLAVLVAQVDTAIVNLATRPVGEAFAVGVGALQWFIDSYNLVYAVLLMTGGVLADFYGRRLVFMVGAGVFTVASLLCAIAPSMTFLIGARALAGLGAAMLLPASLAIIRIVWDNAAERNRALGIWAACNGLAMAIGPTLGGLLIHYFGWRSIFVVVIPLSVAALVLAVPTIPETSDRGNRGFDMWGQCLGALVLGGLALAGIKAYESPGLAALILLAVAIVLILFVWIENKQGNAALVPPGIFTTSAFRGAFIATAGMTFGMYGLLFLLPLMWQSAGRFTAVNAGVALMPMALVFVIVSAYSGKIVSWLGQRFAISGGVTLIALGLLLIAIGSGQTTILMSEVGLGLTGLGMGLATGPLMAVAVGAVAVAWSGTASALINVARMTGATLGVAVLGAIYESFGEGAVGLQMALQVAASVQIVCAVYCGWALPGRESVL